MGRSTKPRRLPLPLSCSFFSLFYLFFHQHRQVIAVRVWDVAWTETLSDPGLPLWLPRIDRSSHSGFRLPDPLGGPDPALSFAREEGGGDVWSRPVPPSPDGQFRISFDYVGVPLANVSTPDYFGAFVGYGILNNREAPVDGVSGIRDWGASSNGPTPCCGIRPNSPVHMLDGEGTWRRYSFTVDWTINFPGATNHSQGLSVLIEDWGGAIAQGISGGPGDVFFRNIMLETSRDAICGDAVCDSAQTSESCATCAADCGACPISTTTTAVPSTTGLSTTGPSSPGTSTGLSSTGITTAFPPATTTGRGASTTGGGLKASSSSASGESSSVGLIIGVVAAVACVTIVLLLVAVLLMRRRRRQGHVGSNKAASSSVDEHELAYHAFPDQPISASDQYGSMPTSNDSHDSPENDSPADYGMLPPSPDTPSKKSYGPMSLAGVHDEDNYDGLPVDDEG
jgi:hypothetical protein